MARPEFIIPYAPNFLGDGFVVPLPGLTPALRARTFSDGLVLDYIHYSLVMQTERRVAAYTAHNVDASRAVRGISGGLDWKMDERVGEYQTGREAYDHNQIDKGHLVRREDVVWGTVTEARSANKSTYFYPNAAPQHQNFNQDEWLKLENWVLHQATDFSYRLCVFTGPVLRSDDPVLTDLPPNLRTAFNVRGPVQLPAAFWKVIVLRDEQAGGDDLSVIAFAMKQTELWNDRQGARLLNLRVHQVTVAAIEEWTGLDFGPIKDADELEFSDRMERTRSVDATPVAWPTIRDENDIVYSGVSRRARGLRIGRSVSVESSRSVERTVKSGCGCDSPTPPFDVTQAIATLGQDLARLTDIVANLRQPNEAAMAAMGAVRGAGEGQQDPALVAAQARADALAEQAPEAIRESIREFALKVAIEADVSRGLIPPTTTPETTRIVGGDLVPTGGYPTCCCIGDPTQWFCTGVLVAPNVVLTAAHCGRSITRVMIGGNKVIGPLDPAARQIAVRLVRVHPQYGEHPRNENDITVLILGSSVANINPTPIATVEQLRAARELELAGFGYNDPMRPLGFGIKRFVKVPMGPIRLSAEDDLGRLPMTLGFHPDYELVAGRKGLGRDSCNGDSGGPAFLRVGNQLVLAGLTSRATRGADVNCGDGGIYVRPDRFRGWINEVLAGIGLPPLP